jgi:MFS family permease
MNFLANQVKKCEYCILKLTIIKQGDFMEGINNTEDRQKATRRSSVLFAAIGWISAILSLFMYPFVFGVLGVIMGILATKGGSKAGLPVIVASILLMAIGLIFSGVIMNYTRHYLGV